MLDASRCGVPQKRERVFVCAQRDDQAARPLKITTSTAQVSAAEATSDLVLSDAEIRETAPTDGDRKWWPLTKPGDTYARAVVAAGKKKALWGHCKINMNGPACTLTSSWRCFTHGNQCRSLSLREWIRLGSFPDDYIAKTPKIGKYMIGMSVPPKMAEVVGAAVRDQWLT
jgi:DNA (cytosine-5)-methyltransferase 1